MLEKEDLVKYPFLKEAASYVESKGLTLKDLASDYPGVVSRAIEWVRSDIEGAFFVPDYRDPETEILAYPLALAIIYSLKKDWVVSRFATAEQKRYDFMLNSEEAGHLAEIARDGFGWQLESLDRKLEEKRFDYRLGVSEFLEVAPQFHSANWKLVNRYAENGKIYLRRGEAARLVSGAAKNKIIKKSMEEELKKFELPEVFNPHLKEIMKLVETKRQLYDEEAPIGLIEEARPPCVVAIANDLVAGKNLSHMARFTITTFMTNIGENVDDVLELFSQVADFDDDKTRYQVEHIAGKIGSKMKYKMPKCDVLRSFGLCVGPNELCEEVWHPLNYYKIRAGQLKTGAVGKDRGGAKAA